MQKIIAVIGPTASGKTDLGAFLCQKIGGEIISADAKQVFRGMDIGTAKEKGLPVKQHLIDVLEPGQKVTVAWYQQEAYSVIEQLLERNIVPVLVGGSGLYAESVLNGYNFDSKTQEPRYQSLKLGIDLDRDILRERVAARTNQWLKQGLVEEIQNLLDGGVDPVWLDHCGQEYRYFTRYLRGQISQEEAVAQTNLSINQFIKRQYTWWRRHPDVLWVKDRKQALALVTDFLAH